MKKVLLWIRIIRPGTLAAALSPVIVGLTASAVYSPVRPLIAAVTIFSAVSIQIFANLVNDYYDFLKNLDQPGRTGPKRALAEGLVSEFQMLKGILISAATAVATGLYLVYIGGIPILIIGCSALFFAWFYTATSVSLSYLGIADLFVLIYFGPVSSVGTAYLQTGGFLITAFWPGLICGFISMAILTVNNIRDVECDRAAGKMSPVVRFGVRFGQIEYLALYLFALPCLFQSQSGFFPYSIIAVGFVLFILVCRAKGRDHNKLLVFTGLSNLFFSITYLIDKILL